MENDRFKKVFRIVTLIFLFVFGLFLAYLGINMSPNSIMGKISQEHFKAMIGLPSAAIGALFLVLILQQTSGPIKFEALGVKLEGSSGEIVLWVLVFITLVLAINVSW